MSSLDPAEWAVVSVWDGQFSLELRSKRPGLDGVHTMQGAVHLELASSGAVLRWVGTLDGTITCNITATLPPTDDIAYTETGTTHSSLPFALMLVGRSVYLEVPQINTPTTMTFPDGTTWPGGQGIATPLSQEWSYDKLPNAISLIGDTAETAMNGFGQVIQWSLAPTSRATFRMFKAWINAFIPGDAPGFALVPAGLHAGKTMIPGPIPGISDCFLTDQRGPSDAVDASSRIHSKIDFDLLIGKTVANSPISKCFPTIEVDCEDGDIECENIGSIDRVAVTPLIYLPDANGAGAPRLAALIQGDELLAAIWNADAAIQAPFSSRSPNVSVGR